MFGKRKLDRKGAENVIDIWYFLLSYKALNAVNIISQHQEEEGNKVTFVWNTVTHLQLLMFTIVTVCLIVMIFNPCLSSDFFLLENVKSLES